MSDRVDEKDREIEYSYRRTLGNGPWIHNMLLGAQMCGEMDVVVS